MYPWYKWPTRKVKDNTTNTYHRLIIGLYTITLLWQLLMILFCFCFLKEDNYKNTIILTTSIITRMQTYLIFSTRDLDNVQLITKLFTHLVSFFVFFVSSSKMKGGLVKLRTLLNTFNNVWYVTLLNLTSGHIHFSHTLIRKCIIYVLIVHVHSSIMISFGNVSCLILF